MKRARRQHRLASPLPRTPGREIVIVTLPKRRNPVARSPLLAKGGAHGKSQGALRRRARMDLSNVATDDGTE